MPFPEEPLLKINGRYPQFSNIEFSFAGRRNFRGLTEINYNDSCEPGEGRGNHQLPLGTTDGEYKAEGSIGIHLRHGQELLNLLGPRFYLVTFDIVVVYDMKDGLGLIRDRVEGVRLKKNEASHKQGPDPLMKKHDLYVTRIAWNGVYGV
jgi:hypothetical protein